MANVKWGIWLQLLEFEKIIILKSGKYAYHTIMIMVWIMQNMVIMPRIMGTLSKNMAAVRSSWHNHDPVAPWSWYDHGTPAIFFQSRLGLLFCAIFFVYKLSCGKELTFSWKNFNVPKNFHLAWILFFNYLSMHILI